MRPAALLLVAASAVTLGADQRLIDAARAKNTAAVRALLQQKAEVNATAGDGATALHWAAHWNDTEAADLLLRAGANAGAADDLGVTPLALACTNGSAAMVDRLLKAGTDPNASFPQRPPALLLCARSGNVDAVSALLARGAAVNATEPIRGQTALMWAIAERHPAVVRVLLARGADVKARAAITRVVINRGDPNDILSGVVGPVSRGGSTPLLFAARAGDVESATLLLDAGANVNDIAPDGASALVVAAHSGHALLARRLLERGANPNVIGAGYTALHAAVLRGDPGLVQALIARGANVNSRLRNGTPATRASQDYILPETLAGGTPFLLAAKFLEIEIMRALSTAGADTRLPLADGTTPLMVAAGVLRQGARLDRRDRIALLLPSDEARALEAARLAAEMGNDVNAANARGDTALHGAAAHDYPSIVSWLVSRGARLEAKNAKGQTPLKVALSPATADLLRSLGARE